MSRIPILMYHSIDPGGSVISLNRDDFKKHLLVLSEAQFEVITLRDALQILQNNLSCERKIVLTFDDGFENFYTDAFPLLAEYKLPAAVFLVSDYCGKDNQWPGQVASVPRLPLLKWSQVEELSRAGIEFGAHSCTHPRLTRVSANCALHEILQSKDAIQNKTGRSVSYFAYPYGSTNTVVTQLVRKDFEACLGTRLSLAQSNDDIYNLSRIDVYYLRKRFELIANPRLSSYLAFRNLARRARQTLTAYYSH